MRDKKGNHGEHPVTAMWYGKMAGKTIEEIIDTDPSYFVWMLSGFLDVTVQQAKYFEEKYGLALPENVIAPPEISAWTHCEDTLENEYKELCKEYWKTKEHLLH